MKIILHKTYEKVSKYFSKKVEYQGMKFDSQKELNYWLELKEKEDKGEISKLQRQVTFNLIPKQYKDNGKFLYHPVDYVADMVYQDENNNQVVVDVKSKFTRTLPDYKLKKKMMYYFNHIIIQEVL